MKKVYFVLAIFTILVSLFLSYLVGYLVNLPSLIDIAGTKDTWIQYWGSFFGSLIGVLGAFFVMKSQLNHEKKIKEEERKPIIVAGVNKINNVKFWPGNDLSKPSKEFESVSELSTVSFPLINIGETAIHDITYKFELLNIDEVEQYLETFEPFRNEKIPENYSVNIVDDYGIVFNAINKQVVMRLNDKFVINVFNESIKRIPCLLPGAQENIFIDSSIEMLLTHFLRLNDDRIYPLELKVEVHYRDYRDQFGSSEFMINFNEFHIDYTSPQLDITASFQIEPQKIS